MDLTERIRRVEERLLAACRRSGRRREDVRIVAVTKYVSPAATREMLDSGFRDIGENRWQDAKPKWEAFADRAVWHFIGHLQTNKVKDVVGKFTYIHSLDRLPLAREISRVASRRNLTVNVFLQINISGEETKYGMQPDGLLSFAEEIRELPGLRVVGLMTMAPYADNPENARPVFRGLRELRDQLNAAAILPYTVEGLSMGMSGDFEIAVEEGATWIRLGSVLLPGEH